jgi:hypothetical protein
MSAFSLRENDIFFKKKYDSDDYDFDEMHKRDDSNILLNDGVKYQTVIDYKQCLIKQIKS